MLSSVEPTTTLSPIAKGEPLNPGMTFFYKLILIIYNQLNILYVLLQLQCTYTHTHKQTYIMTNRYLD